MNKAQKEGMSLSRGDRSQKPSLSVVIPAYNEEKKISDTLESISDYLSRQEYEYEIIVVNDGSTDGTATIAKEMSMKLMNIKLFVNSINRGKGYSVKKGMMVAKGRYVIFSDADLSTPIEETQNLLRWLYDGYDIAVASRGMKESDVRIHQPFCRRYMGKIFNSLVRLLIFGGMKDTQCGFKCFRREVIKEIFGRQRLDHFSFDVEILYIARKMGYLIREVPAQWLNDPHSRVHPLRDSARMFLDLLKIRYNDLKGLYR